MNTDPEQAVNELINGSGYLIIENHFSADQVKEARTLLYQLADTEPDRTSHFHGDAPEQTQKRVWNLPAKGSIFRDMICDNLILSLMKPIIGEDLMLSSYAANITYPGAPAQEPHVDYPYWDLHKTENWPAINASYHLAVEVIVMLDDFTMENGATAYVPFSHKKAVWPDSKQFQTSAKRACAPAGSVMIFPALLWHAAQANQSQGPRAALLGSYTNKNIKPIEDWSRCIDPSELKNYSEPMRQLLGDGYAYPAVMDQLPARSSQGTRSRKNITT